MRTGDLDDAVEIILKQEDEERWWSLYLCHVANALEDVGSFNDFMEKNGAENKEAAASSAGQKSHERMTEKEMQREVKRADLMLKTFRPPRRR